MALIRASTMFVQLNPFGPLDIFALYSYMRPTFHRLLNFPLLAWTITTYRMSFCTQPYANSSQLHPAVNV